MNEAVTLVKIEGESALVADYDYTNATWTAADGGGDPRFYTTGDEVTHSGGIYRCLESHSADNTANTGNEPGVANNNHAIYWKEIQPGELHGALVILTQVANAGERHLLGKAAEGLPKGVAHYGEIYFPNSPAIKHAVIDAILDNEPVTEADVTIRLRGTASGKPQNAFKARFFSKTAKNSVWTLKFTVDGEVDNAAQT